MITNYCNDSVLVSLHECQNFQTPMSKIRCRCLKLYPTVTLTTLMSKIRHWSLKSDTSLQNQTPVSKIRPLGLKYNTTVHKEILVSQIRHNCLKWDTSVQNKKPISRIKHRFPKLITSNQNWIIVCKIMHKNISLRMSKTGKSWITTGNVAQFSSNLTSLLDYL